MNRLRSNGISLIMLGAGPRIAIAAFLVAALWGLFFWATSTPGGL